MNPVAPTVEPRKGGSALGSTPGPDSLPRWPPAYIIAELMSQKTELGEYVADGPYEWSRQAVLYVREAYTKGETICAFAATWCEPEHHRYKEFNARWERLGRPVQPSSKP